jgi:putative oxidoreductase
MRSLMLRQLTGNSFLALFLRCSVGIPIFLHGAQKVLGVYGGKGLDASVQGMAGGLGIPIPLVYLSIFTEFLGGIFIVIGLLTRISSFALIINMLVAIFSVHFPKGFFSATGGYELALFYLLVAIAVFILGPGRASLDHAIFGRTKELSEAGEPKYST